PAPKGEVHTQPVQGPTQPAASPPLTLSEGPVGPKNVSSQPAPVSQVTPPPTVNAASGGIAEGKPLFTSLGKDPLTIDVLTGSKPTGTSGGTVDSSGGSNAAGGGGGGGSSSGAGQTAGGSGAEAPPA